MSEIVAHDITWARKITERLRLQGREGSPQQLAAQTRAYGNT